MWEFFGIDPKEKRMAVCRLCDKKIPLKIYAIEFFQILQFTFIELKILLYLLLHNIIILLDAR